MEYDGLRVSTEAKWVSKERRGAVVGWVCPSPSYEEHVFRFDVSAFSELTLYLLARHSDGSAGHPVISLGFVKVNPFLENRAPGQERVPVQEGTGVVSLTVSYSPGQTPPLDDLDCSWSVRGELGSGDLVCVKNNASRRSYGMKTISIADIAPGLGTANKLEHPFIAPLKFAFKSPKGVSLLSPLATGGQLFYHLQPARRFDVDRAQFYAAELLCALEYLHDQRIILTHLNSENILLDCIGHVSICQPGLFGLGLKGGDRIVPGTPEYPAPELIVKGETSRAVDWWALGVFLYEMLIGLPPFYRQDTDERRLRIAGETPVFPEGLPSSARDILARLLDKDPAKRLGANGASEVKAHAFFDGVDWHGLLQRSHTVPFKPQDSRTVFWVPGPNYTEPEREVKMVNGIPHIKLFGSNWVRNPWWEEPSETKVADAVSSSQPEDDGWELLWEPTTYRFHFKNRFTNEISPGRLSDEYSRRCLWQIKRATLAFPSASDPVTRSPRPGERKEALAAALEAGYSKLAVSQILSYGADLNLNEPILNSYTPPKSSMGCGESVLMTPLEWAAEHCRLDLINLFLENGADADYTFEKGPALITAVRTKNPQLVGVLVLKTGRIHSTRALSLAVQQEDNVIVNILLAAGVQCNFQESDEPYPEAPCPFDECMVGSGPAGETLSSWDTTPPLLYAVACGNAGLARQLLAHGANANYAYHDQVHTGRPKFQCGWVIQLAMELGHSEIVQLLLDKGADISLAHEFFPFPFWPTGGHVCKPVHMDIYRAVTAGLEAAVAARRQGEADASSS
jgi:serum/glucocorticoid-regulated kinase 2